MYSDLKHEENLKKNYKPWICRIFNINFKSFLTQANEFNIFSFEIFLISFGNVFLGSKLVRNRIISFYDLDKLTRTVTYVTYGM